MGNIQPVELSLNKAQLDDLAWLLAHYLTQGNIGRLVERVLGREALQKAGNDIADRDKFARTMVQALFEADGITGAIKILQDESHRNSWLTVGLNHILSGKPLGDDEAKQAWVNEYEPFLEAVGILDRLPRILRAVCAVALGGPVNSIVGSGFLIAPDLVITCYHVVEPFLAVDPETKKIRASRAGNDMFFFFDYLLPPPPNVPPGITKHATFCVTAAENWLVHARESLPGEGTEKSPAKVKTEYDYAVIRLARRVGALPARRGGGAIRGWLTLPQEKFESWSSKRIFVFQHPGKAHQQWDVGDFEQKDLSGTRLQYRVSTAKGSSGGAAIDSAGQLVALHTAEVRDPVGKGILNRRLNQGVRIDLIAEDLAVEVPNVIQPPPKEEDNHLFWSLNDDAEHPAPIIGREKFRELVIEMHDRDSAKRVLVVTGPLGSGLKFSIRLLERTLGTDARVVEFSPALLQTCEPSTFLRTLVGKLGVIGLADRKIPDLLATESRARWLRVDLPKWLFEGLSEDARRVPNSYPAWIVINAVPPPGGRLLPAENLFDFVAALVGEAGMDLHQLRWLFLAPTGHALPALTGGNHDKDDLENYVSYETDYADCIRLAWRAIAGEDVPEDYAKGEACVIKSLNELLQDRKMPLRKALAEGVRSHTEHKMKSSRLG